jgi:hypothetical protein
VRARLDLAAARDDADLAFLDLLETERRGAAADVDLAAHRHGKRGGMIAGRHWLGVDLVLRDERQDGGVARRTVDRIADGLAAGILHRADGGIGDYVPIRIRRADHLAADDAQRRAFGKSANGAFDAAAARDGDAAGDERLL